MKIGGLFVAAALVLTGCSSDPQPRDPTPSPTPTSTATPPPLPPQASEDTPEGAAAFVSYWVEVSNYAAATGDVDELSRISDPDCSGCQSYIDLYRDTYEAGGYFRGGDWELGEVTVTDRSGPLIVFAPVTSDVPKFKTDRDADETSGEPEDSRLTFVLGRPDEAWTLTTLEIQAPE